MNCRICGRAAKVFGKITVLRKHEATYLRCNNCGFIQVEDPFWLSEAYASAVPNVDIGHVARCDQNSKITKTIIEFGFNPVGKFVDFGGGYGLLVRRMRDLGYDYYRQDKYCENLFAKGFEALVAKSPAYELLTAFEVFEHLAHPHSEIKQMLSLSRNILLTTELVPDPAPRLNEWWYYGPEHGQHLSFYTHRALEELASHYGLHLLSKGSLHLLTEKRMRKVAFSLATNRNIYELIVFFKRRKSLLPVDWNLKREEALVGQNVTHKNDNKGICL